MSTFLVERHLPGIDREGLRGAQQAARAVSARFRENGRPLHYVRSTFIPGEDRCLCLFEAADAQTVSDANIDAGLPFDRIVAADDLPGA